MISPWISEDKETRLTEWGLQLIGEGTRSVPPNNSMGTRVLSKLQDRSLTKWPCRLYDDVLWVLNCNNNPGCQLKLSHVFPTLIIYIPKCQNDTNQVLDKHTGNQNININFPSPYIYKGHEKKLLLALSVH